MIVLIEKMEDCLRRLRGNIEVDCGYGRRTALKLRGLLESRTILRALGSYNGQQAIQFVKAGLPVVYVSGWQVAAANNTSHEVYPDQSLYPVDSVPLVVSEIVRSLRRADQIQCIQRLTPALDYEVPIISDGEAGFGGPLHAYELTRRLIEAGAAGVHFEDQATHEKKCGHLGGKVLVPISQMIRMLRAARLAANVMGASTVIIARTDAESASLISSDIDTNDHDFIDRTIRRTPEGYHRFRCGLAACIHRAIAYAPHADMLWFETSVPSLEDAQRFARAVHEKFPGKWLAYNCSPSFRWRTQIPDGLAAFQTRLAEMGYLFQFITLGGYHSTNLAAFQLAYDYKDRGMEAYSELQEKELSTPRYTGARHQTEAGVGYFDAISRIIGTSSTSFENSTEQQQF